MIYFIVNDVLRLIKTNIHTQKKKLGVRIKESPINVGSILKMTVKSPSEKVREALKEARAVPIFSLSWITKVFKNLGIYQILIFCDLAGAWKIGEDDSGSLVGTKKAGKSKELCIY